MLPKGFGNRQPNRIGGPRIRLKAIRVSNKKKQSHNKHLAIKQNIASTTKTYNY
jgi:hypothetical protein